MKKGLLFSIHPIIMCLLFSGIGFAQNSDVENEMGI